MNRQFAWSGTKEPRCRNDAAGKVGQQGTHGVACRIGQFGICVDLTKVSESVQLPTAQASFACLTR